MARWRRMDISKGADFETIIEDNLTVYHGKKEHECQTLEACIEDALCFENHVAFAIYFLKKFRLYTYRKLDYSKLQKLADAKVDEYIRQCETKKASFCDHEKNEEQIRIARQRQKIGTCFYVTKNLWRSPVYEYKKTGAKDKAADKGLYSKNAIERWQREEVAIPRDVLVQHALIMGLNAEETDQLLLDAGYQCLYPLDAVDACEIIYLNQFAGNLGLSPYLVIKTVKERINKILTNMESEDFLYIPKGKADLSLEGVLAYEAGRHIDSELQALREVFDDKNKTINQDSTFGNKGLTDFLTWYYTEKIRKEADPANYFSEPGIEANKIFTQRYYGFLKKTKDYLYDWHKYHKNLESCTWELTPSFGNHDFVNDPRCKSDFQLTDKKIQLTLTKLINVDDSDEYYENCLRLIQYIRTFDSLNEEKPIGNFDTRKKNIHTYSRLIIEGQRKTYKKEQSSILDDKRMTVYAYQMAKKKDIIRFALSAGREEEIGEYLILARYWKKNWYREIATLGYSKVLIKDEFHPDPIDELLIYALLYRDKLIKKWCEKRRNHAAAMNRMRDVFPMRELFLQISFDISFVYMFGRKNIHVLDKNDIEKRKSIFSAFEGLRNAMIFPVRWEGVDGTLLTYDREEQSYTTGKVKDDKESSEKIKEDNLR